MTGKKILTLTLGGLMSLNAACMAVPAMAATAEAAVHHERGIHHEEEFNRAIREEHDRHERNMHEIRETYYSHPQRLHHEMKKERERHEARMKEIHRQYYHHHEGRHSDRHDNHRH